MIDTKISISLATNDEADVIIGLLKNVAEWLKLNHIDQWGYLRSGEADQEIRDCIKNNKTYVAKLHNKIVGTFTIYEQQNEWDSYIWGDVPDDAIYIHRLAVDREASGKGIGRELLHWIEKNYPAENKKWIRLDCVAGNERLNRYYREQGYTFVGITHDHSKYEKPFTR